MNTNQESIGMVKRLGRALGGPAAILRAVAGIPAGVARSRRGTFMVVVIGTLALLAVIAIAHFAVSQTDRRTGASIKRASTVDEVPQQVAKYLQSVIVEDLFVNVPEEVSDMLTSAQAARFIARREAEDRPSTDWRADSTDARLFITGGGAQKPNRQYFTPAGMGTDPWLADIAPQWLNWAGDSPAGANPEFLYRRDWGKISNFSPDGRFVNLANIRNNFAAESGFGLDAAGKPRTSEGLTLLTWNVNQPSQRAAVSNTTDFNLALSANSRRRPAVWDSRQRGAYRAAKEWSSLLPSQNGYADNEWVDTDGDGILDARWAELVDARDLVNIAGSSVMKQLLTTDGRLRWFYAARAIDLSGLINVNTATDLRYEPGMAYPIGITPADIDLKRLLTMADPFEQWGIGYDSILQPAGPANSGRASNYRDYDRGTAFDMGVGAYDSIRWSIKNALVQDRYRNEPWDWQAGGQFGSKEGALRHVFWRQGARSTVGASIDGSGDVTLPAYFPTSDLGDLLARYGVNNPEETSRLESATDGRIAASGGVPPRRQVGFGPLRSNRDETVEANRTGRVNGAGNIVDSGGTTPETMLQTVVDLRSQVTTLSASRDIASMVGNERTSFPYSRWATQLLADEDSKLRLGTKAAKGEALDADGGKLFRAYVRALAPAVKLPGVWPQGGSVLPDGGGELYQSRKTLFYGHQGPELAMLVAGAMATNAQTMFSPDGKLGNPRTLVFDSELARVTIDTPAQSPKFGGVPFVPWLANDTTYCLDPDPDNDERILAPQNTPIQSPAMHLYGFEPQVFITEVGCYTAWRDTPNRDDVFPVIPGQPPGGPITINGDMTAENDDYLFRCVAIQLHNPFDEDVEVSTGFASAGAPINTAARFHYVRIRNFDQDGPIWSNIGLFETRFVDDGNATLGGLTVRPGETVVCYAFNRSPLAIAAHLNRTGVVSSIAAGQQYIRDWAERQFTSSGADRDVSKRAVMVVRVDEAISDVVRDGNDSSLMINDASGGNGMTVQLWKARRADMSRYGVANNELGANNSPLANQIENDQIVDRFRLPKALRQTIDVRIKAGDQGVEGTYGGPNEGPFGDAPIFNHNSGVTIMRWATASRPTDPKDAAGQIPVGGVPAYLLEPKKWATSWNKVNYDEAGSVGDRISLTKSMIDELRTAANKGIADFLTSDWVSNSRSVAFSETIPLSPSNKPAGKVPTIDGNLSSVPYAQLRDLMPRSARGDKGFGGVNNPVFGTELPGTPSKGSTLRAADLLLPMAICPWESPMRPDGTNQIDLNIRFLTASEAFAVAYNYERPVPPSADPAKADPLSLYSPTEDIQNPDGGYGGNDPRPVIERGHVVIDDFVPFFDGNRDGIFNRDRAYNGLNPAIAISRDIRFGLGIPAALGILDQVSAFENDQGSAIRPVAGLININTAPPNVLRMLPLVTPADASWGNNLIWNNSWTQTSLDTDLAASILAYRDKNLTWSDRDTPAKFIGDTAANRPPIDNAVGPATRSTERQLGRAQASHIEAIREETGFLSTAELLCVLERRDADDRGGAGTDRDNKRSLDFPGFNNQTRASNGDINDRKGINSQFFKDNAGTLDVDGVRNDFAERIQIMSALSNVTTVRSDVFAVWFVIRGYAQEDTENLGPDDPMTPSIERRFVMVIDRSGVTDLRSSNKPRIVLFKEVPR